MGGKEVGGHGSGSGKRGEEEEDEEMGRVETNGSERWREVDDARVGMKRGRYGCM